MPRISFEKIKLFGTKLKPTMYNLANSIVILKFKYYVLEQRRFSSLYTNFISNLYLIYELNNWSRNSINNFLVKNVYMVQSN